MLSIEIHNLLAPINSFLQCKTPDSWLEQAQCPAMLPVLLIDHMHCELKAAQSAAFLIRRYAIDDASAATLLGWLKPYEDFVYRRQGNGIFDTRKNALIGTLQPKDTSAVQQDILDKMVRLIKEELHHFEQVLDIIRARNIELVNVSASGYASGLLRCVRTYEPQALVDKLIIGAYIEARSCERFARLAPLLDDELGRFYLSLLRSEARHYQDYLQLAQAVAGSEDISERVQLLGQAEAKLIETPSSELRFHSGPVLQ
jgi:tRNA-(ms[2]io[6]A)-hydroxylase